MQRTDAGLLINTVVRTKLSSHIKGSEGSHEESPAEPAELFHAICAPPWGFIKKQSLHKFFEKVICDGR